MSEAGFRDQVANERQAYEMMRINPAGNDIGRKAIEPQGAVPRSIRPQAFKDQSSDHRKGLNSFFAAGKRAVEADAYQQAHLTPSGVPGVVRMAVVDVQNQPIPFAPFEWDGRAMCTDADGVFMYVEKKYIENTLSAHNEREKYVTRMISLVLGQPAENVIALFGWNFYKALDAGQAPFAIQLYRTYLNQAGIPREIAERKAIVFTRYADADATPEVMQNYGDNDPEFSKSYNKLCLLIEYHPSAIIFDEGPPDPTKSTGKLEGDTGANNKGSLPSNSRRLVANIQQNPSEFRRGPEQQPVENRGVRNRFVEPPGADA